MVILPLPRRRWSWVTRAGFGIAALAVFDLGLYAYLLAQQSGPLGSDGVNSRELFVGGFVALLGVLGFAGAWLLRPGARLLIFGFTGGAGLGLGLLGMDSIGVPLFAVFALSLLALWNVAERSWGPMVTGAYAAFVVILLGIGFTG
jgi:hypothetical protein